MEFLITKFRFKLGKRNNFSHFKTINLCFIHTVGSLSAPTRAFVPPVVISTVRTLLLSLSATNKQLNGFSTVRLMPEGCAKAALWG